MLPRPRSLIVLAIVVAGLSLVGAALAATKIPFRGHASTLRTLSLSGSVSIEGATGLTGLVRERLAVPSTWQRTSSLNARIARFDTHNSCRHRVTFRPRLVEAADVPATDRAATLLPATKTYVHTTGTRGNAAFRVIRKRGTKDLVGVLVQPLSTRFAQVPAGRRVYAEIVATATADPRTECHAGGPRGVGDAFGNSFGAGGAGGFILR